MKEKKQSMGLAFTFSFLVCLAGAVLFGVVYSFGFITMIVPAVAAFLALLVYGKYYKVNWVAYLWVLIWVIILNEVAILLAITFMVMSEAGAGFGECFLAVITALGTDAEIRGLFIKDSLLNVVFSGVGALIEMSNVKAQLRKEQAAQSMEQTKLQNADQPEDSTVELTPFDKTYNTIFKAYKDAYVTFTISHDNEKFKKELTTLNQTFLADENLNKRIKERVESEKAKEELNEQNKKVLDILSEVLKNF